MNSILRIFSFSSISIVSAIIPFLSLPFVTAMLGIDGFGSYSLWYAIFSVLATVTIFGSISTYNRVYNHTVEGFEKIEEVNTFYLYGLVIASLILTPLLYVISMKYDADFFLLSFFFVISKSLVLYYSNLCRIHRKLMSFAFISFLIQGGAMVTPIILIKFGVIENKPFLFIFLMAVLTIAPVSIMMFLDKEYALSWVPFRRWLLEIKHFGAYASLHVIFSALVTISDRVVLNYFLEPSSFSIYALATTLVASLSLIYNKLMQSTSIEIFNDLKVGNDKIVIRTWLLKCTLIIFSIFAVFNISLGYLIPCFFSPEFEGATSIARLLSIGVLFQGLYFFTSHLIFYYRLADKMLILSMTVGIIGLMMNIFSAMAFGLYGVISSYVIIWFFYFSSSLFFIKKSIL